MPRYTKIAAGLIFSLGSFAFSTSAQAQQSEGGVDPLSSACAFNFTSGAGDKHISCCVSEHGNVLQFASPAGNENGDLPHPAVLPPAA
jgi:hypothetical protein